jgi:hypothetical protein
MTSPVDRISGPRSAALENRSLGKIASFAHARVGSARDGRPSAPRASPSRSRQACSTSGREVALATKGTVRDARGLASKT